MTAPQHEDFTELADAAIDRVDLVGKAANGTRFLIAKAAADGRLTAPLVPAEQVAALVAKTADEPVVKDDAVPVAVDDLVADAPAGGTAESLPGSPDWEQRDGDTAMNAVSALYRVKQVLSLLSDREAQEAVTGGDYDADGNSWDLDSMACQIDYIIGALAGFAAGEHLEAGLGDDELEAVGKAVAAMAAPLATVEGLAPIAKAGRTLSGANETKIRNAVTELTDVLNSLPAAPAADDVTKTEETPAVPENTPEPVDVLAKAIAALPRLDALGVAEALLAGGRTQEVAKAKGDPQMAVFSADGKLVGVIDPADLNPIAATEAPSEGDTEGSSADAAPADDAATAPAADDADSRVIPGTDTVQSPPQAPDDDTQTPAVAKAADPAQLAELRDQIAEEVRKSAGLADEVALLKETVRKFGLQPDDRRSPILNGGAGTPGIANRDATQVGEATDVMKAIDAEPDPVKRDELRKQAFFAGATQLYANPADVRARFTH